MRHTRLALKLEHYGVRGNNLKWIQSFLSNRTQKVVLNGKQSETIPVTSGVPQGTVLGHLLFLVYINDLPDKVRSSTARLFADDCLLYRNVKTPQDVASLQEDLNALQAWEKDWQMAFNPSKCQTIHFTRKRNPMILDYTIRDQVLETDESATYLGVKLHATASCDHGHHTAAPHPRKLNAQEPFSRETSPAHLSPSRNSATPPY